MVKDFLKNLLHRATSPFRDIVYFLFILLAIGIFGAIDIWFELIKYTLESDEEKNFMGFQASLSAFYPPLIGVACLQLLLESYQTPSKLMGIFSIGILLISITAAIITRIFEILEMYILITWIFTILLVGVGIVSWIVANSNNSDLQDINASSGGDTNRNLSGNTSGFKK